MVMTEYHKINSLQKRHTEGPLKGRFTGEWCDQIYEYLQHNHWYCREKVDGTNIRIHVQSDPEQVASHTTNPLKITIAGRTDNAQIPGPLIKRLYGIVGVLSPVDGMVNPDQTFNNFRNVFNDKSLGTGITLYGEGFGAGIQKGGAYGPVDFILFDVKIGDFWLSEGAITGIADALGLRRVPYEIMTLASAISVVSNHELESSLKEGEAEGYVCVPAVPLQDKWGQRVIVKVKGVDFL
jgi:hypothetical protein